MANNKDGTFTKYPTHPVDGYAIKPKKPLGPRYGVSYGGLLVIYHYLLHVLIIRKNMKIRSKYENIPFYEVQDIW